MLHDLLSDYLENIETQIRDLHDAYIELYEEEILTVNRINLRIRIRFINGYLLELNEAAIVNRNRIENPGYRFHFQDNNNNIIFRYDNTPHFQKLKNFPHHKHLVEKVVSSPKPSITQVIKEAAAMIFTKIPE